ncbi:hypothetical protein [Nocardia rhizosphaerae]|uniref:Uncharacterized protein n=1 Tax=Nocardia rhizosphaerae TaxID=1691571 RepID=A0ABV8KZB5_9NOCA
MDVDDDPDALELERLGIPLQSSRFNAQEYAFQRRIRVEFAVTASFTSYWSVADRAMLVQADLPGHIRNEVIMHSVAHIEMDGSPELAAALDGEVWRGRIESQVHDVVAHRLVELSDLRDALEFAKEFGGVAAALGVTEFLLGWRLQHLTDTELDAIPVALLDRLGWAPGMGSPYPYRCLWPTASSGALLRRIAPGRHRK